MPNENLKVRGTQHQSRHDGVREATVIQLVVSASNSNRNAIITHNVSDYVLVVGSNVSIATRSFPNCVIHVDPWMAAAFKGEEVCLLAFEDPEVAAVAYHGLCFAVASKTDGSLWRLYNVPLRQTVDA